MDFVKQFEMDEGVGFPGKTYITELLKPVFDDQKKYLFHAMFMIHKAHTIMLKEQGIISENDADRILDGIAKVESINKDEIEYSILYEDLFFLVESKIGEIIGEELAGKMHIAKSRNDMGEAMYRIVIRDYINQSIEAAKKLAEALLYQAELHVNSIMPAHTHTQPAQPTTFGHYLLAIYDNLQRDIKRLEQAYRTVNQSPMGAAAITTTGFPINRERVMELLHFDGLIENSYDAIGTGDYLMESAQALISLMTNCGRWIQEFLRMASKEVGLLKVSDAYVQVSSIMPQKRNPVSMEHSRAIASSAAGEGMTVIHMIHNTPYGDINDTEDDLQPHLYLGYQKALRVLKLMRAVIVTMNFDQEKAIQQAKNHMITITELADVLARDYQIPFRRAHQKASKIAKKALNLDKELYEIPVDQVNDWLEDVTLSNEAWDMIVDPICFVERRSITGGPSPNVVTEMIARRKNKSE
ncbi:argininosuccinate lyase [Agaribacter marinus]|uniref:Argininosuccinate lyase n=1 Tax=Virgibacillus salarius TaxID=447199 RepID=A0A941DV34_9BACI|nr:MULTISPECIES: argininosuccinate lyase [Bacillaceae]MBR7795897.1 argininosuccinate lyase [Virgibacillus salarius]NAZ08609.1 argininosuccinate lyase [Agaribacter marinus]WBX78566.1 argininosuccinate lyase [Virgibacillus salarius]